MTATITLERYAGVGYWRVSVDGHHIGDIRGSRSLGFEAGTPGLATTHGHYTSRDDALTAILHAGEAP